MLPMTSLRHPVGKPTSWQEKQFATFRKAVRPRPVRRLRPVPSLTLKDETSMKDDCPIQGYPASHANALVPGPYAVGTGHGQRPVADGEADALGGPGPHVAAGQQPRERRLQRRRLA